MNIRLKTSHVLGLGLCTVAGPVWAAPPMSDLDDVVVTATRTPQSADDTLAATSVITRADIERRQATSVAELLADTPSLAITNNGGPGKQTSIYMRGMDNNQVLVLVDGVRWGSATSGQAAIQDFPVSQIQRIEIVRGPRSSLYGADAAGGVIQIFTRDGQGSAGQGPTPYFSATGGTYDTWKGQAGVSGATPHAHYNVSMTGAYTGGFDACRGRPFASPAGGAGCYADQPDDDGYNRVGGSANAGYTFDNGVTVDGHYLRTEADTEYDGTTTNGAHSVQEVYGLDLGAPLTAIWRSKLSLSRSRDQSRNDFDDRRVSRFDTRRDALNWQNDFAITDAQTFTLGLDYRQDEITSSADYKETKRDNTGLYGEYQARFGAHEIDLAGRGDHNEAYGDHATGSITYGYHIDPTYTVTAAYGNAFTAPTFNDLYYPDTPGFAPASNPDLNAEKSRTAELGLKARPRWGHWSIHAYQTDVDDQIALNADFTPLNLDSTRIRGIEGEATAYVGRWRVGASANWLDTRNETTDADYGNELARRPDYSASLSLDRDLYSRFSAGADAQLVGARYNDLANTNELGGYALFGLRGEMRVTKAWKVQAKLSNLFDRDYQTVDFYNQPGRTVYFTVRYAPGDT
ncbi:TonB-dependent receptor domain-containing protein [Salinisphaera sp. Q1T1-3]|uniref:TonB-dependent receptor domain-containing protein n=1 Tax=Salinisphaera sp. Q1T1-3 TaxID=2321229 RepID=UPI000E763A65|nr:TonB-dependent receptor [Salinisphaera sp. Q1T1-3]RJS92524.1 TonB-dependent receptor [Salinisphaera sp. Q1T1-3]